MGCGRTSAGPSPLCGLLGWGKHFSCGQLGKISGNKPMAACTAPCTELIQEKPNKKSQRHHSANLHFQRKQLHQQEIISLLCPSGGWELMPACRHGDRDIPQWGRCVCSFTLLPAQGHSYFPMWKGNVTPGCFTLSLSPSSQRCPAPWGPPRVPFKDVFSPKGCFSFLTFSSWRQDQHKEELISPWAFCGTSQKAPKSSLSQ